MFTVNIDENNFILSISHTAGDNVSLNLEVMDLNHLNAYQLIDGQAILNEEKLAELIAEEEEREKELEIADLEENLNSTDYIMAEMLEGIMSLDNSLTFIVDMIRIFAKYAIKYKDVLANRKT